MRLPLIAAALVVAPFLAAQEYPHAFPRAGVMQLFDNERVTVWEVNWKKGVPQPVHRHRYDMAGVYLRYGKIVVTTPDGKATTSSPFEVPRPYFQPKGITHKEEGIGGPDDPERLAIMIDLKDVASPAPQVAPGQTPAFPRDGAKNVLENARVRMWDYSWPVGKATGEHVHHIDSVAIFVTGGTIRTTLPDGTVETHVVTSTDAIYIPAGRVDIEEAVGSAPRAIFVELK